jgi:hypothetical protein
MSSNNLISANNLAIGNNLSVAGSTILNSIDSSISITTNILNAGQIKLNNIDLNTRLTNDEQQITILNAHTSNMDNTSDINKPISTLTKNALDLKANIADPTFTGTVSGITQTMVGLSNVDNTSDVNKPISTLTKSALDLKSPIANPTFTGTVSGITKSMVGLSNVDNTSDVNKPISTLTQSALDLKATISNPVFTGTTFRIGDASLNNTSFNSYCNSFYVQGCQANFNNGLYITNGGLNVNSDGVLINQGDLNVYGGNIIFNNFIGGISKTVFNYLSGTSSNIQNQINNIITNANNLYNQIQSIFTQNNIFTGKNTFNYVFQNIVNYNTQYGTNALINNTNERNTAFGTDALKNNTTGTCNTAIGDVALTLNNSGHHNVAVGHLSQYNVQGGSNNTSIGPDTLINNVSGGYNTCIGNGAGSSITGNTNTCLGHASNVVNNCSNSTAIGYSATATVSNQIVIGTANESVDVYGNLFFSKNLNNISTTVFNYLSGTTSNIQNQLNLLFSFTPSGTIIMNVSTSTALTGYLSCDGSEVSKTIYANLYNAIQDVYGAPSNPANFKLPNFQGLFLRGYGGQSFNGQTFGGSNFGLTVPDSLRIQSGMDFTTSLNTSRVDVQPSIGGSKSVLGSISWTNVSQIGNGVETAPIHSCVRYFIKH